MSFLRRFLGVSRLVNLPNLHVVPTSSLPSSPLFFLISIRRRHPVSRLYSIFIPFFKQIPLYYAILSLSLLCDYRGFYAVMLPVPVFSSPLFADGLTFSHMYRVMYIESCLPSHVYRVMFIESCLSSYVYRVMFERLDRFCGSILRFDSTVKIG